MKTFLFLEEINHVKEPNLSDSFVNKKCDLYGDISSYTYIYNQCAARPFYKGIY